MKLYLSSEGIPDIEAFSRFVEKQPKDMKLGLIFHAKDYKPEAERQEKLKEAIAHFENFGITVDVIDLFAQPTLEQLLAYNVLWMNGGNTLYLRWAIAESKSEELLRNVFNQGVIYAGDSAGAVIAGPTIDKYEIADDPTVAPYKTSTGLNYFNMGLIPHWGSEEYAAVLGAIEESFKKDGYETIRLTDNGYVLIENGQILDKKF